MEVTPGGSAEPIDVELSIGGLPLGVPCPPNCTTQSYAVPGAGTIRVRAAELRALGEDKARAYRATRIGATADGVVSGRMAGRVDVLTEDYLSVYIPVEHWEGAPRFPVKVA